MNNKKKMLLCIFNVSKLKVIIFLCLWFNELRIIFKDFKNTGSVYSFTQESEGRFNWSQPFRLGLYWLFEFLFILYWIKYQLIKTIILNVIKKWEKQILLFCYNSSLKYESSSSQGISPFYPTPSANSSQRAWRINLSYFKTIS